MTTPFNNDPMCFVWMAFQRLYPDKKCNVAYDAGIVDTDGTRVYGLTTFCGDGSVYVTIDAGQTIAHAIETFGHELAHVAAGPECDHGPEWEKAFDAIYDEYIKIGNEVCPDSELVTVEIIGDTARVKDGGETDGTETH